MAPATPAAMEKGSSQRAWALLCDETNMRPTRPSTVVSMTIALPAFPSTLFDKKSFLILLSPSPDRRRIMRIRHRNMLRHHRDLHRQRQSLALEQLVIVPK